MPAPCPECGALLPLDGVCGACQARTAAATGPGTTQTAVSLVLDRPTQIGLYHILDTLGEGGMGIVYLAEQEKPLRRRVALKVIKVGMDTREVIARFEAERQALALMDHPAIATVFDGGTTPEGRPYFAMEFVKGEPITTYCDRWRLTIEERLQLFMQACAGVQHAHQKGVIHRDSKPSNILVTRRDDAPILKVIDFGVAKAIAQPLTERTLYTDVGSFVGTLEYMSPEQIESGTLGIDTRTDIYALGVILYELLTGELPLPQLRSASLSALAGLVRDTEPPIPSAQITQLPDSTRVAQARRTDVSKLQSRLRGDLDWITMKALEKDRARRYETVPGLVADLRHHLKHEPVAAGPPGATYRAGKFVRRHRFGAAVVASGVAALIVVSVALATQARRIAQERDRAVAADQIARAVSDFLQHDLLAQAGASTQARPDTKPDPDLKVRTALDRAAAGIEGKFRAQPLVEASIRQTIGRTYHQLGLFPSAEQQLQRALELRQANQGNEHPDTLSAFSDLALLYRDEGKRPQAESLLRPVLESQLRLIGPEHPDTLNTMSRLGFILRDEGKYIEAEQLLGKSLEGQRRVRGEDHTETLDTMNELALLYNEEGKYDQAEPLYVSALAISKRVRGDEYPDTLTLMNNLGALYFSYDKYLEAEPLFTQVLDIRQRILGAEHPDTLTSMNNLAALERQRGKYEQSELLFEQVLRLNRRVKGAEHPDTLAALINIGVLYRSEGRYGEAEAVLTQVLEARRRVLGPEHPRTLTAHYQLAELYRRQKKFEQAERVFEEILESRRRLLGLLHRDTAAVAALLGRVRLEMRSYAEAEMPLRGAVDAYNKTESWRWTRFHSQSMLGASLLGQGNYSAAEPLLLAGFQGLSQKQAEIPADSQSIVPAAADLIVQLYHAWGKPEQEIEWRAKLQK